MKPLKLFASLAVLLAATAVIAQEAKPTEPTKPPAAAPTPATPVAPTAPDHSHPHAPAAPGQPTPPGAMPAPGAPGAPGAPAQPVDPNAPQPKLELSSKEWNFGTMWAGQPCEYEVTAKNTGAAPLTLDVKTSCGCTAVKKPKSPLMPGESDTFKISYNSAKKIGKANQTVTITSNDPLQPQALISVQGEIKAVYRLDPESGLSFNRLGKDSSESKTVKIINEYPDKLMLKLKGEQKGPFTVELKEIEAGAKYELTATSKPPLPMGVAHMDIVLETGVSVLPEIHVPVQGYVQPPVMVSPTVLYVPEQATASMERIVRVNYLSDKPIQITGIKCDAEDVKAVVNPPATQPVAAAPMGVYDIRVTIPAADKLPANGAVLEISTDSPDAEYKVLKVQITKQRPGGTPVPPQVSIVPPVTTQPATVVPVQPGATTVSPGGASAAPAPVKPAAGAPSGETKPGASAGGSENPANGKP